MNGTYSESVKVQVAIDILEAVVPVEDHVPLPDGPEPGHGQVDDSLEMPEKNMVKEGTYFLPDATCRGLMSAFLKWANTSSHGATS